MSTYFIMNQNKKGHVVHILLSYINFSSKPRSTYSVSIHSSQVLFSWWIVSSYGFALLQFLRYGTPKLWWLDSSDEEEDYDGRRHNNGEEEEKIGHQTVRLDENLLMIFEYIVEE